RSGDRRSLCRRRLGRHYRRGVLRRRRSRRGRDRRGRRDAHHARLRSRRPVRRDSRIRALPDLRRDQTIPSQSSGATARRLWRHGRRCDGGGLRSSVPAAGRVAHARVDRVSPAPLRTAEVIAVGSELLGSTRLDTNSLFLADELGQLGIALVAKSVVGDNRTTLGSIFAQALTRADLVLLTGGLGPTDDDLTREVVAETLGLELRE